MSRDERQPVITTPRLHLREMGPPDLDFVASMLSDPEVMRFYPKPCSREEAEEWIARRVAQYRSHGFSLWLAIERASSSPIGQVGLIPQVVDGVEEAEIGYLIASARWREGFASEAAAAVRDHAFSNLEKSRLISLIRPENEPSQGVARRIGMEMAGRTMRGGAEHLIFGVLRKPRPHPHSVG